MTVNRLSGTPSSRTREWGLAALRIVVGLTFFLHGWQKLFAMGLPGVTGFFAQVGIPLPQVAAPAVTALELAGGAALMVGLLTRWLAIPLAVEMLVAALLVHWPNGFYVTDNGLELVLLLGVGAVTLALAGPGAPALEQLIARPEVQGVRRPVERITRRPAA